MTEKDIKIAVEQLKKVNKEVYTLTVGEEPNIYTGFFRKPTFNEFRMIYPLISKGDDLMADKRLLETCWLGGDNEIIDVDNNLEIFLSIKGDLAQLIEIKASSLKKN